MTTVYEAVRNASLDQHRVEWVRLGLFTREADAKEAVRCFGGRDGKVLYCNLYSNYCEFEEVAQNGDRVTGLAKLTDREKKALGLK